MMQIRCGLISHLKYINLIIIFCQRTIVENLFCKIDKNYLQLISSIYEEF